jgi:hypothetical protein
MHFPVLAHLFLLSEECAGKSESLTLMFLKLSNGRSECLDQLVVQSHAFLFGQRAGLELMDVMAVYQEGAYERLCR